MIVVDTSALIAIVLREERRVPCMQVLATATDVLISAGTLAEALVVAAMRGVRDELEELLQGLPLTVVPVTPDTSRRVADAYARWGKGVHPAALNLGDCFAYALAR